MKLIKILVCVTLTAFNAFAEEDGAASSSRANKFSANIGMGLPFIGQLGVGYRISEKLGVSASYNILDLEVDEASAELRMPEFLVHYYPFSASFFIAAGIGKESLEVTATETSGGNTILVEVDAMTTIIKTGWTWGMENGGFWYGLDLAYIMPSSPDVKITAPGVPTSDPNYQDAVDAAEEFGETAYPNVTFARIGWVF